MVVPKADGKYEGIYDILSTRFTAFVSSGIKHLSYPPVSGWHSYTT